MSLSLKFQALSPIKLFDYPPQGSNRIAVSTIDYACLEADAFLNDVILDFYLKFVNHEILSQADKERTLIFSTFFYNRLTQRPKTKSVFFFNLEQF